MRRDEIQAPNLLAFRDGGNLLVNVNDILTSSFLMLLTAAMFVELS